MSRRIDFLHTLKLGEVEQTIHVCADNTGLPLLLFLHGGPGLPHMPFAHVNAELARSYIVVHWDQRGAGKSYSPVLTAAHLSIEQLVSDTEELIRWLCAYFGKSQVVLVGHSWGSALGAIVAARFPDLVAAYVGIGQIVDLQRAEEVRFDFALDLAFRQGNRSAFRALVRLGPPPYASLDESDALERWACSLAGDCHRPLVDERFFRLALASPVYSWLDLLKIPLGVRFYERCFWNTIVRQVDLFRMAPRLKMPVYFLVGENDVACTHGLARRYFDVLDAPRGKTFFTFERAGHWLHLDEPARYRAILSEQVRDTLVIDRSSRQHTLLAA